MDMELAGGFMTRVVIRMMLSAALVCVAAASGLAQTSTATSETKKFHVIAVDGNQLVVKLPEGNRELTVPDDFRFNVDGKMLSVSELKPGMNGTATITTKTTVTPVTVTEVKNGTVMQNMGSSILVKTEGGMKMFSQGDIDKRGVKIMKDGKVADISELRANDHLTATIITSHPPKVMTEKQVEATLARSGGSMASGSGAGAPAAAAPARSASPPQAAATTGETPKKLPKTASQLPLVGLAGLLSLMAAFGLSARRRRATR
jgi:LPXTG-motif cell wall-anchored protein